MPVAVVALLAVFGWVLLTLGFTYLAREADILQWPRKLTVRIVARCSRRAGEFVASLLSCGECTSLWTGMAAGACVLVVVAAVVPMPAWVWWLLPLIGVCGTGLFNWTTRHSPTVAARVLADRVAALLKEHGGHG